MRQNKGMLAVTAFLTIVLGLIIVASSDVFALRLFNAIIWPVIFLLQCNTWYRMGKYHAHQEMKPHIDNICRITEEIVNEAQSDIRN